MARGVAHAPRVSRHKWEREIKWVCLFAGVCSDWWAGRMPQALLLAVSNEACDVCMRWVVAHERKLEAQKSLHKPPPKKNAFWATLSVKELTGYNHTNE